MKKIAGLGLALAVALAVSGCTSTGAGSGEDVLVVEGYGAEYQQLFDEHIGTPFTEQTGIQVQYSASGAASEHYAAIRAAHGDPGFDVAVMTNLELFQGSKDGLLDPVSEQQVPNLAKVSKKIRDATNGAGVIHDVQQVALMYKRSLFPTPPTSWNVMWDPKYRSGALVFNPTNIMGFYQVLSAAELDGGSITDAAPGFARIADLATSALATPQASAEAVPYMEKGTATVFPYQDGRAAIYAKTTDYDFTVPQEGTYAVLGALGIPVGAAHKAAAHRFMDYWLSPEVQQRWATAYNVGPAVTGLQFPAEFAAKHVTTAEQIDKLKIADPEIVARDRTEWSRKWAEAVR